MQKLNLAVIFGGQSGEHEVSLSSARAVMDALDKEKYNIIPVAITKGGHWLIGRKGVEYMKLHAHLAGKEGAISLESSESLVSKKERNFFDFVEGEARGEKIDLILPLIHGPFGEDGRLSGMLDMLGVPYVFSGVLAHAIGMNKPKAKIIAASAGVCVAKDLVIRKESDSENILKKLKFPLMIKPAELGSSVGISIAKNEEELRVGISEAFRYGEEVLLEEYIKGREFTVTIVEIEGQTRVLAVTEIIPQISEFYDYKAKYEEGGSRHVCPADIPEKAQKKIEDYAKKTFSVVGCRDLARVDFIWDERHNEFYFIDLNTVPGMTGTSLAPEAARSAGMSFSEFLDRLIEGALKRK